MNRPTHPIVPQSVPVKKKSFEENMRLDTEAAMRQQQEKRQ